MYLITWSSIGVVVATEVLVFSFMRPVSGRKAAVNAILSGIACLYFMLLAFALNGGTTSLVAALLFAILTLGNAGAIKRK